MSAHHKTRRDVLAGASAGLAVSAIAKANPAGDAIRPRLIARSQAVDPAQYQAAQCVMQQWRKPGLKINLQLMPPTQQSTAVWMNRTERDMTTWEMVGRPERSELTYALFHSGPA